MRGLPVARLALTLLVLTYTLAAPAAAGAAAPQIPAAWVASVTPTSAVLWAEINPNGEATSFRFEYISAAAYQANVEAGHDGFLGAARVPGAKDVGIGSGTATLTVSQSLVAPLNPLTPATAYRYRPVAAHQSEATPGPTHTLTTEAGGSAFSLPDGRVWELVSPVDKGGGAVAAPGSLFGGGDIQAAAGGGALTYGSATSFGAAVGAPPASQYVSRRGSAGWSTENVSAALQAGAYGDHPDGAPYRVFSDDLARALMLNGARCAVAGTCPPSYSLWEGGSFTALPTAPGLRLAGATADLAHAVFEADGALYEWGGGALETVSPGAGAVLAAPIGAISADGSRVYAYQLEDGPIQLHEAGQPAKALPGTTGVSAAFQAASADGGVAFFTSGTHLYRYLAATNTAADITPAGGVAGVLGASADGNRVYFQDAAGLELWDEGAIALVAAGADAALPSDYPPATATARVSGDGRHLAFLSAAELGGHDNLDAVTGLPDTELYLYDAGDRNLVCASCNPTGERPRGSASIPGAEVNGTTLAYRPRVLAADGRRLFFDSADRLVVADTNSGPDVYQWEAPGEGGCIRPPGCVALISSGHGSGASFLDAGADGNDVFFLTDESLVPRDPGSIDVYDARVGGDLSESQQPIPCVADACQALPNPPDDPGVGTLVPNPGNPPLKIVRERKRKSLGTARGTRARRRSDTIVEAKNEPPRLSQPASARLPPPLCP